MPQANGLVAKSREIWLQILGDTPSSLHIIDSDTDFFHVGGSSRSLIELHAEINKEFNTDMPLIQLFENSTLGAMARQIDPATGSLPASTGLSFTVPAPSNNHEEPSTVPKLDYKIHAIALRRRRSNLPAIFSDPKVQLHMGELDALRLSLSKQAAQEIVKLCLPQRIPMHLIPSENVAYLSGQASFGEESVADFKPPCDKSDGYTATKWASEQFLELISEKLLIPIWIYRPSSIVGDDAPAPDLMTNLSSFSRQLHLPLGGARLDFIGAERVSAEIVDEVKHDSAYPGGLVKYMYESGDLEFAVDNMKGSLERQTGASSEILRLEEWTRRAAAAGLNEIVAACLARADELPIVFPKLLRRTRPKIVEETLTTYTSSFSLRNVCYIPTTYGQLADLQGRRYVMILATAIFLLGSGVCGGASSMDMLIWGRVVQGIGGGSINILVGMIICDLVPMRERGNFMGTTSGPIIGGALTDNTTWR
ncbi:Polyketide synthase-nonribosomal peptide synthetase [Metarhizium brunneum]|uniref:Polyketide synthase-nonribosomal peptide synthetase n=1 Tax=Metarhizium brunneum TaxID=500148 RepID=A0A7D5V4F4_9HYPO|nr:Polyketide synthase-nonribosomal peptide synthetase [Metarhizium brunneum]